MKTAWVEKKQNKIFMLKGEGTYLDVGIPVIPLPDRLLAFLVSLYMRINIAVLGVFRIKT